MIDEYHDARSIASGSVENVLDADEYGYYVGHSRLVIRPRRRDIRLPDPSSSISGGMNVYSTASFHIGRRESVVIDLGFDLVVPADLMVVFRSREKICRQYGICCVETAFGTGERKRNMKVISSFNAAVIHCQVSTNKSDCVSSTTVHYHGESTWATPCPL